MRRVVAHELLRRAAELYPDAEVVDPAGRTTYAEAYQNAQRLATALARRGVGPGTVVGVLGVNDRRFFELHFALSMLGAVIHPLNFRLPPADLAYTVEHAGDDWIFAWAGFAPLKEALGPRVGHWIWLEEGPVPEGELGYRALLSEGRPETPDLARRVEETDPYTIFYTTGTTGRPKGMRYRHRDILLASLAILHHLALHPGGAHADAGDVFLPLIPFFHIHAWGAAFFVPYLGAKLVLSGRGGPEEQLALIRREGVTWMNMVPTQLHLLLEAAGDAPLPLKVLTGGSPLPRGLARRAWQRGIRFGLIYGGSDQLATAISTVPPGVDPESEEAREALATWLLPVPFAQVRVLGEDGRPVPRDGKTLGEVVADLPWLPPEGYHKDPEKSRLAYREEGFRSGDLAVVREDGRFFVVDREKDAIKSGGEWIPSAVLEAVLSEHPGVAQVAVLAMPDERWGERPLAVVQPAKGAGLDEVELLSHLERAAAEGRIARYWIPDRFVFVEAIPLTSAGKLHKAALRQQLGLGKG